MYESRLVCARYSFDGARRFSELNAPMAARVPAHLRPSASSACLVCFVQMDKKVLHCAWHPTDPCVAVGACNTVYVYYNDEALKT